MAERSCWTCLRFEDCDRLNSKSRKYQLWNAPHKFFDFYRLTAENCKAWTEDSVVVAKIEANELLKKVDRALRAGKVVALNDGTDSLSFLGEYNNEFDAQVAVNGKSNVLLLKAVSNHNPRPPQ